jgi:phosphoglucosamine mutase
MKIVVDCAHGAAYKVAPEVLEELGAQVVPVGVDPDGENINRACGALHPQEVQRLVRQEGAQVGLALDGDGDRAVLVDEKGEVMDGDFVLAIAGCEMLKARTLRRGTLVTTVMSNLGLELALRSFGGQLLRVAVGDRYVAEEMLRSGCNLGGEQSGHVIFLDHTTTGDGLITFLALAAIMLERDQPLSELKRVMRKFPQVLINVPVRERRDLASVSPVAALIQSVGRALGEKGRVLVRYSGTEPLVRIMVEGEDEGGVRGYAAEIPQAVQKNQS